MPKQQQQITIRMNRDLYKMAKDKCKNQLGISLSPFIKIFLKAFVTQRGIGFYVGDHDLRLLIRGWIGKKRLEINRKGCAPLAGPLLKDIFDL